MGKVLYILGLCALILSCNSNKDSNEQESESDFESYVWIDNYGCLHRPHCMRKYKKKIMLVAYIDTTELNSGCVSYYCPSCIKYDDFKHYNEIMRRNNNYRNRLKALTEQEEEENRMLDYDESDGY